jgi:hypothetical protein
MNANNQYHMAIASVGGIVEPYDATKMFPTFGFGGIPRHMGAQGVSHCFSLNGNPGNPNIFGIANILQTYQQTLAQIALSGPTYFGDIIEAFVQYTQQSAGQTKYNVLLLLTDGVIHDMPRTKELIVAASALPCSIIIVGVGNADFTMMEELDSDDSLLRAPSGKVASRDIVQFVQFNECMKKGNLAEQVLMEVPEQVSGYCNQVGWKANKVGTQMNKGLGGMFQNAMQGVVAQQPQQQQMPEE